MNTAISRLPGTTVELTATPGFGLYCRVDDPDDPAEVTVFAPDTDDTTHWITVDADSAVPIDEAL